MPGLLQLAQQHVNGRPSLRIKGDAQRVRLVAESQAQKFANFRCHFLVFPLFQENAFSLL
jgi:hypothetical protein